MCSRLEARVFWTVDLFRIPWQYEVRDFALGDQRFYRPDGYLPPINESSLKWATTWIEIKGFLDEATDEELLKFEEFAEWRIGLGEQVLLVPGDGPALLFRDDEATREHERNPTWLTEFDLRAAFRLCPSCRRWRIGRSTGEEPCTICGHFRRLTELQFTHDIFCVKGYCCQDSELSTDEQTGQWVVSSDEFSLSRHYNVTSYEAVKGIARCDEWDGPLVISRPAIVQCLEWFEKHDPQPKRGATAQEWIAWNRRYDDALASVRGTRPAYEFFEHVEEKGGPR